MSILVDLETIGIHPAQKRLVVLESPYQGDSAVHVAYARRCLKDSLERGEAPIASHLLYTQVLNDDDKVERAIGINAGHAWMHRANVVAVYTDYGISDGMKAGISAAEFHGKPVEYRTIGR